MKTTIKRTAKKAAAVTLALAMAFSVSPVADAGAKTKVKKPTLTPKTVVVVKGKTATLTVKKGTYKIKSIKWTTSKKNVATVSKKGKLTAKVTAKDYGTATIKAVVTTKKSAKKTKKYTLPRKVEVIEDGEPDEPEAPQDTWLFGDGGVSDYIIEKFNTINSSIDGASYTPFSLAGLYVGSDGVKKWRVLAKKTLVIAEPVTTYVMTEISEDGNGVVSLDKIIDTEIKALPSATEALDGGWSECADPMLTPDERSLIDVNINPSDLVGGTNFSVISKIGTQIVAGVKYKLLLEMHVAGIANPESSYVIADVLVGADGTVTPDLTTAFTISME